MNRCLLLLFVGLLFANRTTAQDCRDYPRLMREGAAWQANKKYSKALNKYNAAKLCDPTKAPEVDKRLNALFVAIDGEKLEAERQRDAAKIARKQAETATRRASEATTEALRQANQATALYLVVKSDNLEPQQAVPCLLHAFRRNPYSPPLLDRLVKRLNAGTGVAGNLVRLRTSARLALFSPDGARLLTATDGTGDVAQVWDTTVPEPKPLVTFKHGQYLHSALFSPDGRTVLTTSLDGALLWDASATGTPQPLARFGHTGWVRSALFSPDGRRLLTASDDSTAKLWDVSAREVVRPLATFRHDEALTSAQFSPDGNRVLTVSLNATRLWDAAARGIPQPLVRFSVRDVPVRTGTNSASFSPDGRRVLTASGDSTARLWDASGRGDAPLLTRFRHGAGLASASFSPDGRRVLTVSDKVAKVWEAGASGAFEPLCVFTDGALIRWALFSPDGGKVLLVHSGNAGLWYVPAKGGCTSQPQASFEHESLGPGPYPINFALFSPDGSQVLTASATEPAKLWPASAGGHPQPEGTFEKNSVVNSASFSRDGGRVVIASGGEIRIWFTATGAQAWAREHLDQLAPLSEEHRFASEVK